MADEVRDVVEGDGYAVANVDGMGDGPGFRKVRRALGVTAFGVNAIELPAGLRDRPALPRAAGGALLPAPRADRDHARRRHVTARPGRPGAGGRRDRPQDQERGRRARPLPRDRWQGRLRGPRRPAARGRDQPRGDAQPRRLEPFATTAMECGCAATLAYAAVALARAASAGASRPRSAAAPSFPSDNPWNQRVDRLPVNRNSDAIVRSIGLGDTMHADFGSGLWDGGPDRDPVRDRRRHPAAGARVLRLRRRVGSRPAIRCRRGAPIEGGRERGRRPPRDRRRPLALPALRAVRRLPARRRRALERRLGRDLEPALEPAAPARLDLGGRRRPADPARAGPLRRGQARPHRPRAALHGGRARGRPSSTRPATSRPT